MDPLKFKDSRKYVERLDEAEKETGETDALVVMQGSVQNVPMLAVAFEFGFLGGSMGSVVGERFVRAVQACCDEQPRLRVLHRHGRRAHAGGPALAHADGQDHRRAAPALRARQPVHLDPHRSRPWAACRRASPFIGDVVIAEPGALIGFAGPRVIEQTVRETLPEGFQRSDSCWRKGAIDMIVDRRQMREKVARLVTLLKRDPAPEA
jgi:acetyl-CoA carboxylase carboxyl transferase subunit beta